VTSSSVGRVAAIIARVGGLGPEEKLDGQSLVIGGGVALDSVGVLEMLVALEQEFGVELNADELVKANALGTIGSLAAFLDAKVARS
jgi:acyl carrier protein